MKHVQRGFTLVELVMVIIIIGIIAAAVAVFIPGPVRGYMDATSRADIADIADTAARRIARDVQLSLPNSVRVDSSGMFLELLPIKSAGRYFQSYLETSSDPCFSIGGCTGLTAMGNMVTGASIVNGSDQVTVYNQYNNSGADCSASNPSVYCAVASGGAQTLTTASWASPVTSLAFPSTLFVPPGGSPTHRVFIIAASPVTYQCDASTGTLWRISGYARQVDQSPASLAAVLSTGTLTALATNISCPTTAPGVPPRFSYATAVSQRYGLLSIWITVQENNENISLLHQVHVDNTP